ncbi:Putative glycoside hydrolase, family 5, glycoside hydrolase superfamily [Septoria linicola]|uniref:glucan endo-1,6-beta-glucosidase n=1 Tax=Septoria linicola TaxID=215465 RepID=A0A9Q9EF07_9PEZI|nr:putative glycoside hydrolase, family 5, glycoside hydrolase superfamily [Septoria linicola]USW48435.1 Putative glycoside hydrolase, family 5, glycoside hydrolase superfamily [Septoria linicola]
MQYRLLSFALLASGVTAWLPQDHDLDAFNQTARFEKLGRRFEPSLPQGQTKIRGVNFGAWLISEPFFMQNEWSKMGCGSSASEFDCMKDHYSGSNRATGNTKFANHWRDWINPATVQSAHDVGLNTIRIPIGYWSYAAIVDSSEPFPDPAPMLKYLDAVVQKATDLGMYVIIDFHGAPGGQQEDVFTGQNNKPAGFFNDYNFGRAEKWLSWMTNRIHTNSAYASVGMIEVLNEPVSRHDANGRYPAPGEDPGLIQKYYPAALKAVRDAESSLNVADSKKLHVQFMSSKWDSGDPRTTAAIKNDPMTAYDDHNYIGFAFSGSDRGNKYKLMHSACTDSRVVSGQDFTVTGEWSMTSDVDKNDGDWFKQWFTAQQQLYEKPGMDGWVYWTWKTELNDPRWTYSYATYKNYIPTDAAGLEKNVYQDVCSGFR